MDIREFHESVLDEVRFNSTQNGTSPREEFMAYCAEMLVDAEELEDYEQIAYEGVGSRNRKIQIDGFNYSSMENCLSIIICPFADSSDVLSISSAEVNQQFKRARAFVEESLSGFILKYAEESSPGYGLAWDIQKTYKNVRKYKFYLITDMVMSNRIKDIQDTKIENAVAEYHIWDIQRLKGLQDSKTGKEEIVIDLCEFSEKGIPCLEAGQNGEYTAYLCSIPGLILAKLYNRYGGRLLEGNVRSFLSVKGKINKEIRNTILNQPDMFFAYNNGIAATAYGVKIVHGEYCPYITEITSLQIVNGGQTTASLAAALNDRKKDQQLCGIYVPMKLSVVTPQKAEELIPNIAKYANKQNKVSDADFFSNHAFHVRMEDLSRRVLAPAVKGNQYGTHWYYERARGQYKQEQAKMTKTQRNRFLLQNPKAQMFTKTDLAKYYNIYRQLPHIVSTGAQKNFIRFAEWANDQWAKDDTDFNEAFFKRIVCLNILFKRTDYIVKHADWYEMGYKAQVVTYTVSYLFYAINRDYQGMSLDFKSIWNRQELPFQLEIQLEIIAKMMYNHLVSPDRDVENVTEWAKRENCWKKARELMISFGKEFRALLVSDVDEKEENRAARKEQRSQNNVSKMIQVAEISVENWKSLAEWGRENRFFTAQEISLINAAIAMEKGKFPTEKQCGRIMKILEKALGEGFALK